MKKPVFYTEAAYFAGLIVLALGTAFMERADFGLFMVVAPAYLVYLKVSQTLPWFTFGMAEYSFQALLLVLLCLAVRRFNKMYLFSFVTAVIYGFLLDGAMALVALLPPSGTAERLVLFVLGLVMGSFGVALLFRTYIAPEAYELFVKVFSARYGFEIHRVKTVYDICSCACAVLLSFAFFGLWHFEGVKLGTVLCALINGKLIGLINGGLQKGFEFKDGLALRHSFE